MAGVSYHLWVNSFIDFFVCTAFSTAGEYVASVSNCILSCIFCIVLTDVAECIRMLLVISCKLQVLFRAPDPSSCRTGSLDPPCACCCHDPPWLLQLAAGGPARFNVGATATSSKLHSASHSQSQATGLRHSHTSSSATALASNSGSHTELLNSKTAVQVWQSCILAHRPRCLESTSSNYTSSTEIRTF